MPLNATTIQRRADVTGDRGFYVVHYDSGRMRMYVRCSDGASTGQRVRSAHAATPIRVRRARRCRTLNSVEAVKRYFKQETFGRDSDFGVSRVFEAFFGNAVGTASGDTWSRIRRLCAAAFSNEMARCMAHIMQQEAASWFARNVGRWPVSRVYDYAMRVLCRVTYGEQLDEQSYVELGVIRALMVQAMTRDAQGLPTEQLLDEYRQRWYAFNRTQLQRLRDGGPAATDCILGRVSKESVASDTPLSESQLFDTLSEASIANVDVIGGVLAWLLLHLAVHQNEQEQLHRETLRAPQETLDGTQRSVLSRPCGLDNFIKESARLRPIITIATPEVLQQETTFEDFIVPGNAMLTIDFVALHSCSQVFPEPRAFRPERWENPTPAMNQSLNRFGLGRRRCMGRYIAEAMTTHFLLELLRSCRITPVTALARESDIPAVEAGILCHPDLTLELCTTRITPGAPGA